MFSNREVLIAIRILALLTIMASAGCLGSSGTSDAGIGVLDRELEAPGIGITGLAWGNGLLWTLDDDSDRVYAIDTDTGEIQLSFPVSHERSLNLTGLAYSTEHRMILVGLWNGSSNGYVYRYSRSGEYLGSVNLCGG